MGGACSLFDVFILPNKRKSIPGNRLHPVTVYIVGWFSNIFPFFVSKPENIVGRLM